MNSVGGILGLFNVQGATWRTHIRTYHQHDPAPRALTARVRPSDVPLLPKAERYVAYSDKLQVRRGWVGGGGLQVCGLADLGMAPLAASWFCDADVACQPFERPGGCLCPPSEAWMA